MSKWKAGIIRKTSITPSDNTETGSASGVWRASDAAYLVGQNLWPKINLDPYFPYNTLLLNGDGLQDARNNTFVDSSSVYSPVTRYGNTTQGSFSPYGSNWSNYFDGNGDFLSIADNAAFDFGTGDFTIECWVYLYSYNSTFSSEIFSAHTYGTSADYIFNINTTGKLFFQIGSSSSLFTSTNSVPLNTWTHIAVVRSGNTFTPYINGVNAGGAATSTSAVNAGRTLTIGSDLTGNAAASLNGHISNLRVVKGTAVYTSTFTPPTQPLTAISGTSLLTCQSNRFIDTSTNNFAVTRNGDSRVSEFSPFAAASRANSPIAYYNQNNIPSWSNYFDGTGDNLSISNFSSSMSLGSGDFTIELWVYPSTGPNNNWSPFLTIGNSGGGQELRLSQNINGTGWGWLYPNNSNNGDTYAGYGTLPINQWHHIAMVRSGSTMYLFRNGVQVATGTSVSFNHTNTTLFRVAMPQPAYSDGTFNGYISNVRIVKGTALYTSGFTPPTSQLTAVSGTVMLTCQSPALTDRSSLTQSLTVNGDVVPVGFSPFNGTGNYSGYFDGSGDYISIPSNAALDCGTSNWTIEGWVMVTTRTTNYPLFFGNNRGSWTTDALALTLSNADNAAYNDKFCFAWNNAGFSSPSAGANYLLVANVTNDKNKWYHFAVVRNGTSIKIYRDGVEVASATISAAATFNWGYNGALAGGGNWDGAGGAMNGFVSNLRLIKGTALYTSAFTPSTTPLTPISGTSLLTLQDNRFVDNSTNAFTITTAGDVKTQTFNPFTAPAALTSTGSVYLDGSGDFLTAPHQNVAGSWTLEFWWYPTNGVSSQQTLVSFNNGSYQGINIWCNSSAQLVVDDGATGQTAFSTTTFRANQWNHVAIVRNGSTTTGYINGVAAGSNSFTPQTVGFISVGRYNSSPFYYAYGYISDLRFVNGTVVYSSAFTPPTAPVLPTPNTTFKLDGLNGAITDLSSLNNLETGGTARVNTSIKKYGSGSMYFDGSSWLYTPSKPENYFGTGNFTIEGWFYFLNAATNVDNGMFGNYLTGWGSSTIYLGKHTTYGGKVALWVANYSTGGAMLADPNLPPANTWVHYAVVRNGNTWTMYRDGTSVASQTYSGDPMTTKTEYVIGRADATAQYFYGYIDEFRISKYARYTANFTPSTTALPIR